MTNQAFFAHPRRMECQILPPSLQLSMLRDSFGLKGIQLFIAIHG